MISEFTAANGNQFSAFVNKIRVAVRYGVTPDAAFHIVVLHQGSDHIVKRMVVRISNFDPDDLTEFILEGLLAFGFHLPFGEGLTICVGIRFEIAVTDRIHQSALFALLTEVFAHIIKVTLIPAECVSCINVAVADQEMHMDMRFICMNCEQHLIAFEELLCKFRCNFQDFLVAESGTVLWRKGNGHLIGEIRISGIFLAEQFSGHDHITGEVVTVSIEAPIEIWGCFYYAVPYLFRQSAEHIVRCLFHLKRRFAGLVIDIHISKHHVTLNFGLLRKSEIFPITSSFALRIAPISARTRSSCPMLEK